MGRLLFMCSTRELVNIKNGYSLHDTSIGCCYYNVITYYINVPKHQTNERLLIELELKA